MKLFTRFTALCVGLMFFVLSAQGQTVYPHYNDGQLYIKIHDNYPLGKFLGKEVNISKAPLLKALAAKYGITRLQRPFYTKHSYQLGQVYRVYFSQYAKVDEFIAELQKDATVEYAEKVPLMKTCLTPDDLGTQSFSNGNWALFKINAQQAWDISTGSTTTKIAVIDNAVQTTHTDLSGNIWVNPGEIAGNNIDDDGNGYIDDVNGWDAGDDDNNPNPPNTGFDHGTHCAGIASARTNNGTGVASIGYNCKIMAVKATANAAGSNSVTNGYDGVVYALDAGADVMSLSWGGNGGSQTEQNIFNTVRNAGIVVFAAAGNDNTTDVFYPAGYNFVTSVASTGNNGSNDQKSSFSNYGTWIDISAPGASIRSTVPTNAYGNLSGTSMACPLVAGLAGLIVSINPNLTPAQIESCIQSTADNINSSNSSYVGQLGSGRINAYAAVQCAAATVTPFDAQIQNIGNLGSTTCGSVTFTPQVTLKNNGTNTLTSVAISWRVDNGNTTNFNWTGSLASQASTVISMPQITVASGSHTYTATTASTVNGSQNDGNSANNTLTTTFWAFGTTGINLPFVENFESASFTTNGWTLNNPDNATTWDLITTGGQNAGTNSARMYFYSYNAAGQRDGLISPPFNFSNLSAASMTFEYAYKRYNNGQSATATDSLLVYVSTDCGVTWPFKVFLGGESGAGNFATAASSGNDFTASVTDDWCFGASPGVSVCPTINLNAYVGQPDVRIKFEGYNSYGNNLFLDDINLTGTVISNPPPDAQFSTSATTICAGQSITFTNTSTNNPTSIMWTFPGGNPSSSTANSPVVTFANAGTYQVKLKATNTSGTDSLIIPVTVNAIPNVTVTPASSVTICAGNSTTLTASGGTTYTWSPGTGLSGTTGASVTANPTANTTYTVTGTANGCTKTATTTVNVTALPNVQVTASTGICAGSNTTLTATGASTYTWSPATGLSSTTGATVTASPTATQTYTVTGTASGCTKTATTTVTVTPLPNVTVSSSNNSICSGATVTLTANGGTTYSWTGAGLNQTTGSPVTANPTATTTYTVTGTSNGCSKQATATVTVTGTAPNVQLQWSANQICSGQSATLTASGATSYVWSPATGLNQTTGASVTASPTATQTYTVTGTTGSCFNTANVSITVNPTPNVQISASTGTICTGASAILTGTGATTYTWTGSDGFTGTGTTVSVSPIQNTVYTVSGTTGNCTDNNTVTINVGGVAPNVAAEAIKPTICEGESTPITASGAVNYSWSPATGLSSTSGANVTASPATTTTYTVTGDDGSGCTNTFDVTVTVNSTPNTPSISINNGSLISSPATYYQWYKDGVLIQGATNQSYAPTENGTYTVFVTDGSNCSASSSGFVYTTGIAENNFNGTVALYPNPAQNEAFVDVVLPTKATITIRMYNSVGQTIAQLNSVQSLGGRFALPVSGLAGGVYFVEISTGTQYLVKKLVLTAY